MSIALDNSETKLLTRPEAAAWLRARYHVGSKSWLAALSVKGQGPAFAIIGKHALYDPQDLQDWINERFLSAKTKHSAASHNQKILSAQPIEELPSEEQLGEDSYLVGVDVETIALGLKIAAELAV